MNNAMSELASRCAATAEKTRRNMVAIEETFYRALLRGKKEGELKRVREPRAMARFLYNSFQGLVLMSKATQDRKTLEDIVEGDSLGARLKFLLFSGTDVPESKKRI